MQIKIKTKNLKLTESLESVITKRMSGLKRIIEKLQSPSGLLVEVEKETRHHLKGDVFRARAMITVSKVNLVARAHGENLLGAITEVKSELERVIRKHKTRTVEVPRRQYRKMKQGMV